MSAFYLAAAMSMAAGRAVTETDGRAQTSAMAFFAIPGRDLAEAASVWLAEMAHLNLTPIMVHGFGSFAQYDPDFAMFEMDDGEAAAMAAQADETGRIVVSDFYAVGLPEAKPRGVYFGAVERPDGLVEVAVRGDALADILLDVLKLPNVAGVHGLSDAVLADDAATFDGKPLGLVVLSMASEPVAVPRLGAALA